MAKPKPKWKAEAKTESCHARHAMFSGQAEGDFTSSINVPWLSNATLIIFI